jgi:hypothetical protein
MLDRYQDRMAKQPKEKNNGQIKLFPEPKEGDSWW